MSIETVAEHACWGGIQGVYRHQSRATGTTMTFSLFQPPAAKRGPVPVLYYLSGLTCTWENATIKAGAQAWAAKAGLMLVFPDTSPRGEEVANHPDYDLGQGAGFYVDATEKPWAPHFHMESYVTQDLRETVTSHFRVRPDRAGITGHSMGGHGAITLFLRHPGLYASVSAFAPILMPTQSPWGQKVLGAYLGPDEARWAEHDSAALIGKRGLNADLLIDQGGKDEFLASHLRSADFLKVVEPLGLPITFRLQGGYDHSYYFVQSFIADHIAWHAARLT